MSTQKHWAFLKDRDSSFGMFYPKHYTLAGFSDRSEAEHAAGALHGRDFAEEDVHVVSGAFLMQEIKAQEEDGGWLDRIKASIAEFIGTETYFIDQDITLASQGGCFVLVYTPDEADGERAEQVLRECRPVYARRYLAMAIERLIEPAP